MAFPVATGIVLLIFLAYILLFDGISRIIHGAADKSSNKASRIFSIVAGAISIALPVMIICISIHRSSFCKHFAINFSLNCWNTNDNVRHNRKPIGYEEMRRLAG
jgi:hypothetical protein